MKIPNINCKHYSSYGQCMHPGKKNVFFFFRPECILIGGSNSGQCMIRVEFERPNAPPPPPAGRDIKEGEQPSKPKSMENNMEDLYKKVTLDSSDIKKRTNCMEKHQDSWTRYSVGSAGSGRVSFAICKECGCRTILNDVFQTENDINRRREAVIGYDYK